MYSIRCHGRASKCKGAGIPPQYHPGLCPGLSGICANGKDMTCGVPQGSVLRPLLWNIASDDILKEEVPPGVTIICYTDDTLVVTVAMRRKMEIAREWQRRPIVAATQQPMPDLAILPMFAISNPATEEEDHPGWSSSDTSGSQYNT